MREVKIAPQPEALVRYFDDLNFPSAAFGSGGPSSQSLHAGLVAPDAMRFCSRRVKTVLSAMT
ncbi:hypothetical protein [Mesorhizobium sp. WSM3626]|uniref:hypothetical protein n=1 Tax=Mesorhizobium sp. WSM3626 TaxID=1040987 RepID=UPI00047F6D67|nr:hypothetical protein [Mesorhizobium sp. WSM3626]